MNDLKKQNLDLDEAREGVLAIVNDNKYAAVGAGVLASIGALLGGPIGSAAGGAIGGLVGNTLDRRNNAASDADLDINLSEEDHT